MRRQMIPFYGQSMVEIGAVLALVALSCIGALTILGNDTAALLSRATGNGTIAVTNNGGGLFQRDARVLPVRERQHMSNAEVQVALRDGAGRQLTGAQSIGVVGLGPHADACDIVSR